MDDAKGALYEQAPREWLVEHTKQADEAHDFLSALAVPECVHDGEHDCDSLADRIQWMAEGGGETMQHSLHGGGTMDDAKGASNEVTRWERVRCSSCGTPVSSPVVAYGTFVVRAYVECPDCTEKGPDHEAELDDLWKLLDTVGPDRLRSAVSIRQPKSVQDALHVLAESLVQRNLQRMEEGT